MLRTEEEAKAADAARDKAIMPIGNLVHDSVPVSNDEARPVSSLLPAPGVHAPAPCQASGTLCIMRMYPPYRAHLEMLQGTSSCRAV